MAILTEYTIHMNKNNYFRLENSKNWKIVLLFFNHMVKFSFNIVGLKVKICKPDQLGRSYA